MITGYCWLQSRLYDSWYNNSNECGNSNWYGSSLAWNIQCENV